MWWTSVSLSRVCRQLGRGCSEHGWKKHGKNEIMVSFECQMLKSEKAAEDHIKQFIPKLVGQDAVGTCSQFF